MKKCKLNHFNIKIKSILRDDECQLFKSPNLEMPALLLMEMYTALDYMIKTGYRLQVNSATGMRYEYVFCFKTPVIR